MTVNRVTTANITGTGANEIIVGNTAINAITGGGGNDNINAGDGNDTITGGTGNDIILPAPATTRSSGMLMPPATPMASTSSMAEPAPSTPSS